MSALIFAYDHPFAMVTKDDGVFELKNINVGTKLTVEFWHEAKQVFKSVDVTFAENETKDLGKITISK